MRSLKLDHKDTGRFSKIIIDYLEGNSALKSLYKYDFELSEIENVIKDKQGDNINRKVLVESLLSQNAEHLISFPVVSQNIELLNLSNSFTITSGHQLCIFGGPMYFMTKVVSVIKTTKILSEKYPEYNFIPVFWLAAEDHGRGEVNSINLFGKKLSWEDETKIPTGSISSKKMSKILSELKAILGNTENANELLSVFLEAYNGERNLVDATRYYLTQFFGDKGLVLIDGDDKLLKNLLQPIAKEEIDTKIGHNLVNSSTDKLIELGYKGQVHPRDINFFHINDKQERVGIDKKDLLDIDANPEKYSPNVIFRPLYQELILPNLAYIGGPGEIAYWFQLKELFEHFKINFPMLIVRDNSMFIPASINKKINKLNLRIDVVFKEKLQLEKELINELSEIDLTLVNEVSELSSIFEGLKAKVGKIDKSLIPALEGEKVRQLKSFEGIAKRIHKAEKKNQEDVIKQLETILNKLFPEGKLQERHENFMSFYLQKGKSLFEEYEKAFNPFDKKFIVLVDD
jgi:bacillithiol biosynthesis cysteine-adding enzyme BshC